MESKFKKSKFKVHEGDAEILFGGLPYCNTLDEHFSTLPKEELVNDLCSIYSNLFQGNLDWFTGGLDRVLQTRELPDDVCGRLAVEKTYLESEVVGYSKGTQFKPHEGEAEKLFGHLPYFETLGEHFNSLPISLKDLAVHCTEIVDQLLFIEKYKGGMDYILQTRMFPEVISELSSKERKQLVNHIIDTAKRGYLNTNAAVDCNQEAQWEQIHTYLPIQIIRTRDTSGAAKLSICTPEDLEELAGVEIISYGKFPHAQQSDADVVTGIVWAQ